MSAAALNGATDSRGPIFNDSAAKIRQNLSNGRGYLDFEGCGLLAYIHMSYVIENKEKQNKNKN